jgi:hypothetical protein
MASEHRGKAAKVTQYQGIEENVSYPLCCDRCLGPSNLLRMTKEIAAKKCNVCSKPFTLFSWKVAADQSRPKSTIICRVCAESRGKCQSCLGQLKAAESSSDAKESGARRQREEAQEKEEKELKLNLKSATITTNSAGGASFSFVQKQTLDSNSNKNASAKATTTSTNDSKKQSGSKPAGGFSFDWMGSIE